MIIRTQRIVTVESSGSRTISLGWCGSTVSILKWLEIICCIIIIILLEPYLQVWKAYSFEMFTAAFCLAVTFLLMVIYFLRLQNGALNTLPWRSIELLFDLLALILFLITFALAVYDTVKMFENSWSHHDAWTYYNTDLKNRMAAICAFVGANAIFYMLSATIANRGYIYI